jgi:heat shock protein HtpX
MAFNFWEAQRRARSKTTLYLTLFVILTCVVGVGVEAAMYSVIEGYNSPVPFFGIGFILFTFAVAGYQYSVFLVQGGKYVAKLMDGVEITDHTPHIKQRQLLNIVKEMSIAANLPVPDLYIIDAHEINAFTAGTKPDNTIIAITTGALNQLNRDQIQGVIAHEFGHIYKHAPCGDGHGVLYFVFLRDALNAIDLFLRGRKEKISFVSHSPYSHDGRRDYVAFWVHFKSQC